MPEKEAVVAVKGLLSKTAGILWTIVVFKAPPQRKYNTNDLYIMIRCRVLIE